MFRNVSCRLRMTQTPAHILIVDDNPMVLFAMAHLLKGEGFRVSEARDGAECLKLAKADLPDLVLLDVMLPDVNGVELCRRIKAAPETNQLFVVLLSSIEVSSDSQVTGLAAGADGYIARPIENRELVARVQAMLRIRLAEAALRRAHDDLEKRVADRTKELSQANEALKALSLRLTDVQEAERRFLARELHDEIGQTVTCLKLLLDTALRPDAGAPRQAYDEALGLVNDLIDRVRRLSIDLRPQMLDDLGLMTALEWHINRFQKQSGIAVQFRHMPMPERLAPRIETALFRIVQEALTNVARHAKVKEVTVRLWANAGRAGVQVEDAGAGFDVAKVIEGRASSGVSGMKERVELLGGEFTLESSPGQGACLTVELPMDLGAVPVETSGSGI